MTMLSYDGSGIRTQYSTSGPFARFRAELSRRWHDYRTIRDLERVPGVVMKDIGYPAAGGR